MKSSLLEGIVNTLQEQNVDILVTALASLEQLFILGKSSYIGAYGVNEVCKKFAEVGGLDRLERLQNHRQDRIGDMAEGLIDEYFRE